MTVSTAFQEAIDLVDDTKTLTFSFSNTYADLEWSYSGLAITGGSDTACEFGAAALLDAMGFRFWTPQSEFWKLPDTIPTDLSASRQSYWIPSNRIFLVYGHSWAGTNGASRALLNDTYAKWQTLNGVSLDSYPAGHRWNNIITSNEAFFAANPDLIRLTRQGQRTFNLAGISGTANYDLLAEFCAAFMLQQGLNEFDRTNFDPIDGDDNSSDLVFPFSLAVATRMRAGTDAIGGIPAQQGNPNAQIGVYAYAGHRLPPAQPYKPGVFSQIALAFNSTGLTYQDLIEQHGSKADAIGLREYLDTQVWSQGNPMVNARTKRGYLNAYDAYRAAGVAGTNSEFTANWLVNIVAARAAVLKFRTGTVNELALIDELIADVFDGDQAVKSLYLYWTDPFSAFHKWSLKQTFDYVNAMRAGWYRTHFERLCVILYRFYRVDNYQEYSLTRSGDVADSFGLAVQDLLSKVTAVRDDDIIHSYAFIRQQANNKLSDYPSLKFSADPEPAWFSSPVAPTNAEFASDYAALTAETARDEALDSTDFVLKFVEPVPTGNNTISDRFYCEGLANYVVAGPSIVSVTDETLDETVVTEYGAGFHTFSVSGKYTVSFSGGFLFLDTFPSVRKDPDGAGNRHYLFVPPSAAGQVDLEPSSRWSFYDKGQSRKDWVPATPFPDLGPGQVAVDNANTRGSMTNVNCNRYLSPHPNVVLMARKMANRAGGGSKIRIAS